MDFSFIWLYITCGSKEEAERISHSLVSERLVACTNILENMQSFYWWQNDVQSDQEVVLIAKTQYKLFDKIKDQVESLHSYDVPCVIALPIVAGNKDYLEWIVNETEPDFFHKK